MTEAEFQALAAQGYNRVPLVLESFADLDTPLSLYLKLANRPYSFLLESVVGGERFGRYSFIGLPATTLLRARGREIEVEQDGVVSERHDGDPLDFIAAFQRRYRRHRFRACRASAADSPDTSATTSCATSRTGWPRRRPRRSKLWRKYRTSCCC